MIDFGFTHYTDVSFWPIVEKKVSLTWKPFKTAGQQKLWENEPALFRANNATEKNLLHKV